MALPYQPSNPAESFPSVERRGDQPYQPELQLIGELGAGVVEVEATDDALGMAADARATIETEALPGDASLYVNGNRSDGAGVSAESQVDLHIRKFFGDKLTTRSAREGDHVQLAGLELRAFRDVYGDDPSPDKVASVQAIFEERIDLLGDWIKVMEDEKGQLCGMMVCSPISVDPTNLIDENMTSNESIHKYYDPDGKNFYIVNLAIDPDAPKNVRYMLFGAVSTEAIKNGSKTAFFESRLPGLKKWCAEQGIDTDYVTEAEMDTLAQDYWQLTKTNRKGKEVPVDPLLRIYVQCGSTPIRLVKEAWSKDNPSAGYGVFCKRPIPAPEWVLESPLARKVASRLVGRVSGSNVLMKKLFDR